MNQFLARDIALGSKIKGVRNRKIFKEISLKYYASYIALNVLIFMGGFK
jgi:hypothetical protein